MGSQAEVVNTVISIATVALVASGQYPAAYILAGSMAAQYIIASVLGEDAKLPSLDTAMQGGTGIRANARSTTEPIKVLYGRLRIGGNDVYSVVTGTDNNILWIVQTLSEGECDSIHQDGGVDQVYLGDLRYDEYGGNAEYCFHSGTAAQVVDATLNAADANWTDPMRYTSYIIWKLTYDRNYFQSFPKRSIILNGRKLYDLRDASTIWSDNLVLCLYDYMTNSRYGLGVPAANLDEDTWKTAATYCDTKGWTFNYLLTGQEVKQDILDLMCLHGRLQLIWWDNKFYLKYCDLNDEASVMTLTDDHIVQDGAGKDNISITEPSIFKKPDALSIAYTNPDNDYVIENFLVGNSAGAVEEFRLLGCTNKQQAADLGIYELERRQLNRLVSGIFRDDAIKLEQFDVVTFNSTALGIADQLMRVTEATYTANGQISLSLMYENLALYDDSYNLNEETIYTCSLPDPTAEPPAVANVTSTEETYNYRLRTFTRLKITFDPPADYNWYDHVEVWISYDDATWKYLYDTNTDFNIDSVEEGTKYYIRLKTVSIWHTKQLDANDFKISHLVVGFDDAPDNMDTPSAIITSDVVNIIGEEVDATDVVGYEFRVSDQTVASWSGAAFLAFNKKPVWSLSGMRSGSFRIWCSPVSNNGSYSGTPVHVDFTVNQPKGYRAYFSADLDQGTGVHDDTEFFDQGLGDYCLRIDHAAALTGTWTSAEIDIGEERKVRVEGDFITKVISTTATWDALWPDPGIWTTKDVMALTWSEIFGLTKAAIIKAKLKWGTVSGVYPNEVNLFELLSVDCYGRYFQVEVTITDTAEDYYLLLDGDQDDDTVLTLTFYI